MKDFAEDGASSSKSLSPKSRRIRLGAIAGLILAWCLVIVGRLFSLQIYDFEKWQDWALKQHFAEVKLASERGPITDRNDKLLALSVPAESIYVRPHQVVKPRDTAVTLAKILQIDEKVILQKLSEKKSFVWIQRQLPRALGEEVREQKLPGVGTVLESKRVYPFNESASSLIGKVGVDGIGLSGIESVYESVLHGTEVSSKATRDAFGKLIQVAEAADFNLPKGQSLRLTLDSALQRIVDEELESGRISSKAKSAVALIVDADTGEILAMSQSPAVNFNTAQNLSKEDLKNLAVETVFEPGSIMKPLVAAAALDAKVVGPQEIIDCEKGRYPFGKHVIKDVHPSGSISFFDVVVRSSNIGMTKVGVRLGADRLHGFLTQFGFGRESGLKLPGESGGILRSVKNWAQVDVATHSFGQGIAVTPLQMVRAMAAIANGGRLPELRLIDNDEPFQSTRVVSEDAAEKVQEMLYGVVEDEEGTGGNAAIEGVRIGGKTGTAQKARKDGRGYAQGAYVASFIGFADASNIGIKRNLVTLVMMDEPRAGSIYGGTVSAPVFQKIMQRALHFISTRQELGATDEIRALPRRENSKVTPARYQPSRNTPA